MSKSKTVVRREYKTMMYPFVVSFLAVVAMFLLVLLPAYSIDGDTLLTDAEAINKLDGIVRLNRVIQVIMGISIASALALLITGIIKDVRKKPKR